MAKMTRIRKRPSVNNDQSKSVISSYVTKEDSDISCIHTCFHCSKKIANTIDLGIGSLVQSSLHFHHDLSACSFLGLKKLIIFAVFISMMLQLQLCYAQKYTFGKSHNPLLQQSQNIVIPHIKYGQGLNRWSFLSVDRENHGLLSDLLCPNPMMATSTLGGSRGGPSGGVTVRVNPGRAKQQPLPPYQPPQYPQSRFPGGQVGSASSASSSHHQLLPNEIWALKTDEPVSILPCSLRQFAVPPPPASGGGMVIMTGNSGAGRHNNNNGHFIENRILFINVSLVPFKFHGAIPCSKYIKLMYDEEEGTNLRCGDIPFDPKHDNDNKFHINWPSSRVKRKDYFSLLDNLERFLQNEQTLHRQFYFQIYFTSQINGRSKRCTVQQYELDLSYPAGNARFCNLTANSNSGGGHEELCGEFHCDDLIFPLYTDSAPQTGHHGGQHGKDGRHRVTNEDYINGEDETIYSDEYDDTSHEADENLVVAKGGTGNSLGQTHQGRGYPPSQQDHQDQQFSWMRMVRMDMRLLIFFTIVPLVLFGVLVFGLELIVYFMCCRKRRDEDDEGGGGTRSQQLLENSLNVWENVPSRMDAQRTVSFSPMTTSIYGDRKNNHLQTMDAMSLDSHPETPKILKSALKSSKLDHGSPTTTAHHYFDYHDHDMPPSYIETTTR